jgi:hypothetical protein
MSTRKSVSKSKPKPKPRHLQESFDDSFTNETGDEDGKSEDSTDANADPDTNQHKSNEQFYIAAIHAHDPARSHLFLSSLGPPCRLPLVMPIPHLNYQACS